MKKIILATIFISFFIACNSDEVDTKSASQTPVISKELTEQTDEEKTDTLLAEVTTAKEETFIAPKPLKNFIPTDHYKLDEVKGILKNGKEIIALVLAPKSEKKGAGEQKRTLTILEKNGPGYLLMATNTEAIMCKQCGGVFGDPYNGLAIKGDVLTVSNYGGSAWRWSEKSTYRYQNEDWKLIGYTSASYFNAKACNDEVGLAGRQLEDINFLTGKMQIVHTDGDNCEPKEDYWKAFGKKKLISLNDFPGGASQWPNGKIKDGDGQ